MKWASKVEGWSGLKGQSMAVEYSYVHGRRHPGRWMTVPRHLSDIQLDLTLRHPLSSYLNRIASIYLEASQIYLRGRN